MITTPTALQQLEVTLNTTRHVISKLLSFQTILEDSIYQLQQEEIDNDIISHQWEDEYSEQCQLGDTLDQEYSVLLAKEQELLAVFHNAQSSVCHDELLFKIEIVRQRMTDILNMFDPPDYEEYD